MLNIIIANNSTCGVFMLDVRTGDKVRLKAGARRGERGVVESADGAKLTIRLEDSGQLLRANSDDVTNYSKAARKAWVTEPGRAVGRRKGTRLYDRVSVTLRFDREVWERFVALEKTGAIGDRTAEINEWFREKLAEFDGKGRES
jgi:hypothetical protein